MNNIVGVDVTVPVCSGIGRIALLTDILHIVGAHGCALMLSNIILCQEYNNIKT